MFIARATCTSKESGDCQVAICSDKESEERFSKNDDESVRYAKYDRPIADAILRAAAKDVLPVPFKCNGVEYNLIAYTKNHYERIYNKYRAERIASKKTVLPASEIQVYTQRCRCVKCYSTYHFDKIRSICGYVPLANDVNKRVPVDMQECVHCLKIFIDAQSLEQYERQYGKLDLRKKMITGNELEIRDSDGWYFKPDSILSRNGYSTKLSERERRQILVNMMEAGVKKVEIKDKLSDFIFYRSERNPVASVIWKADLKFVNDYQLGSEPIHYFR